MPTVQNASRGTRHSEAVVLLQGMRLSIHRNDWHGFQRQPSGLAKVVSRYSAALRSKERHERDADQAHARRQLQNSMVSLPQNPLRYDGSSQDVGWHYRS